MKSGVLSRWLIVLICLVVLATTILCCTPAIKPQKVSETEILRKRATEFYAFKAKGDIHLSYEYEIPSYRARVNVVNYIRSQGQAIRWTGAEVREIEVEGERARVEVFIKYRIMIPQVKIKRGEELIKEEWRKEKGEWYHIR